MFRALRVGSLLACLACLLLLAGCGASDTVAPAPTPNSVRPTPTTRDLIDLPPTAPPLAVIATALRAGPAATATTADGAARPSPTITTVMAAAIHTVFLIVLENHNWSQIKGNANAPYLNNTLLALASYAEQYYNPPGNHPSEPNYLWLEAGTNFGIYNDNDPRSNHQAITQHLVTLLNAAGISWKSYQEGISGASCPLVAAGLYAPKHNPMVFFDDVSGGNAAAAAYCIAHVRPYDELGRDLANNKAAAYNFITPNLCDDLHGASSCLLTNSVKSGDNWLAGAVPPILASPAYQQGGVLFITWDEGLGGDGPIGLLALSPFARGQGYANTIHYTHSSLLRSVQEIFRLTPLLGDAAQATDLRDLFMQFP